MGCNCGGDIKADVQRWVAEESRKAEIAAAQGAIDARRVMCLVCPARKGKAWARKGQTLGVCTAGGVSVGLTIAGVMTCPRGRHPDQTGRVRWLGISWLGVPIPIRWISAALGRERGGIDDVDRLPGCGCIERLKLGANRLADRLGK